MKTFNYHSAKEVKEASKLASSNSAFLAGGMTTIPSMKLGLATYKDLIDIKGIKNFQELKPAARLLKLALQRNMQKLLNPKKLKKQSHLLQH